MKLRSILYCRKILCANIEKQVYIACKQGNKLQIVKCLPISTWWLYHICASYNIKDLNYIFIRHQRSDWPSAIIYNTSHNFIIPHIKELFHNFRPVHHSNTWNQRADKFTYAGQNGCCFRYQKDHGVSVS